MKLNFDWKNDGRYHQYCAKCYAETVERVYEDDKTFYFCKTCKVRHERSIVIDPAVKWWVADDGEYWHESSGVFIRNEKGKYLFFERTIFPFALTVPSGHIDTGEDPLSSAQREVREEVGLENLELHKIGNDDIVGDKCRRGADVHKWHAYYAVLDSTPDITVQEEGRKPVWLHPEEALAKDLVYPVKYVLIKYRNELAGEPF